MAQSDAAHDKPERPPESYQEVLKESTMATLFGDHPKAMILNALLSADPKPLNPASIAESAGISRQAWYDHREDLLATGLVEDQGQAGNSTLYGLPQGDERAKALRTVLELTGAELREG